MGWGWEESKVKKSKTKPNKNNPRIFAQKYRMCIKGTDKMIIRPMKKINIIQIICHRLL